MFKPLSSLLFVCCLISVTTGQTLSPTSSECTVNSLCTLQAANTFVNDPYNCHKYFPCEDNGGSVSVLGDSLDCDDGDYFDESLGDCATDTNGCLPKCGPPPNYCQTLCLASAQPIPNPADCSTYYLCNFISGIPTLEACPTGLFFTGTLPCTNDARYCCDACNPYCTEADIGKEIRNPHDCQGYYYCDKRGYASRSGSCPAGNYFDMENRACKASSTTPICESYCEAAGK